MTALPLLAALALGLAPAAPTPPAPPAPPAPAPGPLPHLLGSWAPGGPRVSVSESQSVDSALTAIAEAARWNLVLDSGSEGEPDVGEDLSDLPAAEALSRVLGATSLVAYRQGEVVVVYPAEREPAQAQLSGFDQPGPAVSARVDERVDVAVRRVADAARWGLVANTGEDGDALLRLRLEGVPAREALRAVLTGTGLGARLQGGVVSVAHQQALASPGGLAGLGAGGPPVSLSGKLHLDDALERLAKAAGWQLQARTGEAGDDLLVVELSQVPAGAALQALLAGTPLSARLAGSALQVTAPEEEQAALPGLPALPALPGLPGAEVLSGFEQPTGKAFTGDFTDAPLPEALRKLADAAGLSLVLPGNLQGTVSAHFQAAPVEDALRAVLAQGGLRAQRQGAILTVTRSPFASAAPQRLQERLAQAREQVERAQERAADRDGASHHGDRVTTGDLSLAPGEKARDVVALRGNIKLGPGAHAREVTAVLGSVEVGPGAVVERDVVAVGGGVHVLPGARVGSEAVAVGGQVVSEPGAVVHQRTAVGLPGVGNLAGALGRSVEPAFSPLIALGNLLAQFAVFFALGLIMLVFWPQRLERVSSALANTPARSTAVGMLGVMVVPILTVLLLVTLVGIPLILVEFGALMGGGVLGMSALALLVGRRVPLDVGRGASVANLAMGTAVLVAATNLPWVGWLFTACASVVVLGAVLSTRFGTVE